MRIQFPKTTRTIVADIDLSDQELDDMCAANPHVDLKRTENGVIVMFRPLDSAATEAPSHE